MNALKRERERDELAGMRALEPDAYWRDRRYDLLYKVEGQAGFRWVCTFARVGDSERVLPGERRWQERECEYMHPQQMGISVKWGKVRTIVYVCDVSYELSRRWGHGR